MGGDGSATSLLGEAEQRQLAVGARQQARVAGATLLQTPFSPCSREVCFLVWGEAIHDDDKGSWEICRAGIDGKGDTHMHPKGPGIQMVAKEEI